MLFHRFIFLTFVIICSSRTFILSKEQGSNFQQSSANDSKLIFAHVIYRHGARNIVRPYPNDPYKSEFHWPGGFGQLTNEGKMQAFKLGQYLRRRYGKLVGDKYSPNKVYVRSTDKDRTLMSAQANLAGLFPPTTTETWNKDIPWQPIPVHTIPANSDYILHHAACCSKYRVMLEKYMQRSQEVQRIYTEYAHLFSYWSRMCGQNLTTIFDVSLLYNTLCIEKQQKKFLPDWAETAIVKDGIMEYISMFSLQVEVATPQLARCKSGFLIKQILEHVSQKVNLTLHPDRSLWLYSAHDLNITHLLKSLGLFKFHFPSFCSSLHFELYKDGTNEHYFQLFYRQSEEEQLSPMNIPECGEKCHLNQFYAAYSEIIPGDFDTCQTDCSLE